MTDKQKKYIMDTARHIEFLGLKLEEAVEILEDAKIREENVYILFNGKKLYSLLGDEDSWWQEVTGETKKEFLRLQEIELKKYREMYRKKKEEAELKIPMWIERGEKYVYPQKKDLWVHLVNVRAHGIYNGAELDNALAIMECLDNGGTIEKANEILKSEPNSGSSYGITLSIVFTFSKRGPEFYKGVVKHINEEQMKEIVKVEKENAIFEKEIQEEEKGKE